MLTIVMALLLQAQNTDLVELRFHRVHLKNGNFIDGTLLQETGREVTLQLRTGEIAIRRDQIEKIEFVKMKGVNEKPDVLPPTPGPVTPVTPGTVTGAAPAVPTDTPEAIRKRVDMMVWKVKTTPGDDRAFNIQEMAALGDEAAVYLASRIPNLDLKTLDAAAAALIQLKCAKAVPVLEGLLNHDSPNARAAALSVLSYTGSEQDRLRYARSALRDREPRVRAVGLSLAGATDDKDFFDPACDLCSDPSRDVRSAALQMARRLAAKHGLQDTLIRTLVGNLSNGNEGVRADSAGVIGVLGKPEAWTHLANVLNDPEPMVRASTAQALSVLGAPESGEQILSAIRRETDRPTRVYLAKAAQRIRLLQALEPLVGWLSDPDDQIKNTAEATLRALTGENFGMDRDRWAAWVEKNAPK